MTSQRGCGTLLQGKNCAVSLGILKGYGSPWHSHLMVSTCSQGVTTLQHACGRPIQARKYVVSLDIRIGWKAWHTRLTESGCSRAASIIRPDCGGLITTTP